MSLKTTIYNAVDGGFALITLTFGYSFDFLEKVGLFREKVGIIGVFIYFCR